MRTLVLHGFSGNAAGLKDFMNGLQLDDCIAIDLPGFGDNHHRPYEKNWKSYVKATYDTIREEVGVDEPLHIIGHSHGAMVAFCLAAWYPESMQKITLICPVARGSFVARASIAGAAALSWIIGKKNIVRLLRWQPMVDFVTYFSKRDCKDAATYRTLQNMRRKEAELYSVQMYSLLEIIQLFHVECDDILLKTPAKIIEGENDILVSGNDIKWYQERITEFEQKRIPGGHVAPITQTKACALACR